MDRDDLKAHYAHYFMLIGNKDDKYIKVKCQFCPGGTNTLSTAKNATSDLLKHLQLQQDRQKLIKRLCLVISLRQLFFHVPLTYMDSKAVKKTASLRRELQSTTIILSWRLHRGTHAMSEFWGEMTLWPTFGVSWKSNIMRRGLFTGGVVCKKKLFPTSWGETCHFVQSYMDQDSGLFTGLCGKFLNKNTSYQLSAMR